MNVDGDENRPNDDDEESLVEEVLHDFPPDERGERPEWKDHVGWHRKEDILPGHDRGGGAGIKRGQWKKKMKDGGGGLRNGSPKLHGVRGEHNDGNGEGMFKGDKKFKRKKKGVEGMQDKTARMREKMKERIHSFREREGDDIAPGQNNNLSELRFRPRFLLRRFRNGQFHNLVFFIAILMIGCMYRAYTRPRKRSEKQTQWEK